MTSSLPFRNAIGGVAVTTVSGSYLPLPSFCFVTLLLRILSIKARSEDEGGLYPAPPSSSTAYPNDIIHNNVLLETVRGYCFLQRSEYHPLTRILTACAMSTLSTSPLLSLT